MNYFLLLVIVAVCGGAYYNYTTDHEQITTLQQQVSDLTAQLKGTGAATEGAQAPAPLSTASLPAQAADPLAAPGAPPVVLASRPASVEPPRAPVHVAQLDHHSSAIDMAANTATAAANSHGIGTITTLNQKTYSNCKVLKVETDGVTFSHDEGITKIAYPLLPPDVQKEFGYTPEGAVVQTAAEIRTTEQAAAVSNATPATP